MKPNRNVIMGSFYPIICMCSGAIGAVSAPMDKPGAAAWRVVLAKAESDSKALSSSDVAIQFQAATTDPRTAIGMPALAKIYAANDPSHDTALIVSFTSSTAPPIADAANPQALKKKVMVLTQLWSMGGKQVVLIKGKFTLVNEIKGVTPELGVVDVPIEVVTVRADSEYDRVSPLVHDTPGSFDYLAVGNHKDLITDMTFIGPLSKPQADAAGRVIKLLNDAKLPSLDEKACRAILLDKDCNLGVLALFRLDEIEASRTADYLHVAAELPSSDATELIHRLFFIAASRASFGNTLCLDIEELLKNSSKEAQIAMMDAMVAVATSRDPNAKQFLRANNAELSKTLERCLEFKRQQGTEWEPVIRALETLDTAIRRTTTE